LAIINSLVLKNYYALFISNNQIYIFNKNFIIVKLNYDRILPKIKNS